MTDKQFNNWLLTYRNILHITYFRPSICQFIAAQVMLETGWLSSAVYLENYNLFGMRKPSVRPTLAIGDHLNHARYLTPGDSVYDYMLWLVNNGFQQDHLEDVEKFAAKLSKTPFNPSSDYVPHIKAIYNQCVKQLNVQDNERKDQ